jgi:hypothetical protein
VFTYDDVEKEKRLELIDELVVVITAFCTLVLV